MQNLVPVILLLIATTVFAGDPKITDAERQSLKSGFAASLTNAAGTAVGDGVAVVGGVGALGGALGEFVGQVPAGGAAAAGIVEAEVEQLAAKGFSAQEIVEALTQNQTARPQFLRPITSDEQSPLMANGSHGGGVAEPESNTFPEIEPVTPVAPRKKSTKVESEQVALPVMSSLETAREAIEEEVRKGNIPASAVGPLLAKIAPLVEQFTNRLTQAGDDEKKIRDLLKEAPRFTLEYERGADSTQVIAQVVNGMKDAAAEAAAGPSAAPATGATGSGSAAPAYNQPAPAVVVLQQPATSGTSPMITTVSKKPLNANAWNPKVGEDSKAPASRRPIAEIAAGTPAVQVGVKAGVGTGMGTGSNAGVLNLSGKVSKSKAVLSAWVQGVLERMREKKGEEERTPASDGEKMASGGFSVLKTPKLSSGAAILKFPEAAWDSTAVTMHDLADTWELPEWARFLVLLTGTAFIVLVSWLIVRRRFFPRP